jgi:hypothetical protein
MVLIHTNGKFDDLHEKNDEIFKRLWNKPALQLIQLPLSNS